MKSPTVLNYEIRPCKFAERRMLLASLLVLLEYSNNNTNMWGLVVCLLQTLSYSIVNYTLIQCIVLKESIVSQNWNSINHIRVFQFYMGIHQICFHR